MGLKVNAITGELDNVRTDEEIAALPISMATQAELDTKVTQADVDTSIAALVDSSPEALNTLGELATSLGNDPNFATTVISSLADKVNTSDISNVDNTSDEDKPISNLTQTELDLKANAVDLNNVDNTSDTDKPISIATQESLDKKANTPASFVAVNNPEGEANASGWTTNGLITLTRNTTDPLSRTGDLRVDSTFLADTVGAGNPNNLIGQPYIAQDLALQGLSQVSQKVNVAFDLNTVQLHSTYPSALAVELFDPISMSIVDTSVVVLSETGVQKISLDMNASSSASTVLELRIKAGSYKLTEQPFVSSNLILSIDNVEVSSSPLQVTSLVLSKPQLKISTKFLTSDITSDTTDITDLRRLDLTPGRSYRVFVQASCITSNNASRFEIVHDGNTIGVMHNGVPTEASNDRWVQSTTIEFVATSNILTFSFTELAISTLVGDGTRFRTYSAVTELPYDLVEVGSF